MKFTHKGLQALKPKHSVFEVTETGVSTDRRGLQLRVYPSGRKVFMFRYHVNGKQRRMTIGEWPQTSLEKAHKVLGKLQEQRALSIDPADKKKRKDAKKKRQAEDQKHAVKRDTVAALAQEWVKRYVSKKRKDAAEVERKLAKDVLPFIGRRNPNKITVRDANMVIDAVVDRGSPIQANHTRSMCLQMFKFGQQRGSVKANHNPFAITAKPGEEKSRDRTLNDTEIHRLWHGLKKVKCAEDLKIAIKLLLATGQRRGEVAEAQWQEFDLEKRLWTIPASRTKSKREHIVPLSDLALDLLSQLQAINKNDKWLFPIRRRNRDAPISLRALTHQIYTNHEAMGIAHFVVHDLRRTVRTNLAALGVDPVTAKKLLNHALEGMDAIYDRHDYLDQKTAALQTWADRLNEIVTGEPATVVPIRAAS